MIGETLGKYRLTDLIGKGGMAHVYRAEHVVIGGQFAVKVLSHALPAGSRRVQRLLAEARITATIGHPGLVKTFDFGHHSSGRAYLVMEYLDGESLDSRLRRETRVSVDTALSWTRQMTSALKAAHDAGIIHRDLKPANVFIVPDSEVPGGERLRVLDFGVAKAAAFSMDGQVTQSGVIVGTPNYMSPEQCMARPNIDPRSDLYSLGCILFRMLVGHAPFATGEAARDVFACHIIAAPPPPRSLVPEIPEAVEALILRLLAKEPAQRFAGADELIAAVDRLAGSLTATSRKPSPTPTSDSQIGGWQAMSHAPEIAMTGAPERPRRRRGLPTVVAACAVAAAVAVWWSLSAGLPTPPVANATGAGDAPPIESADSADSAEPPLAPAPPRDEQPRRADRIRIVVDSEPSGASVYQMPHGLRIGVTPTTLERDPAPGEVVLVVKKAGYEDRTVVADASASNDHRVSLTPLDPASQRQPGRADDPGRRAKRSGGARSSGKPDRAQGNRARRNRPSRPAAADREPVAEPPSRSPAEGRRARDRDLPTLDPFQRHRDDEHKVEHLDPFQRDE